MISPYESKIDNPESRQWQPQHVATFILMVLFFFFFFLTQVFKYLRVFGSLEEKM